jgi:hypothetical protein
MRLLQSPIPKRQIESSFELRPHRQRNSLNSTLNNYARKDLEIVISSDQLKKNCGRTA